MKIKDVIYFPVCPDPVTEYLEESSRLSNIPTNLPREKKRKSTELSFQDHGKVRRLSLHRKAKSRSGFASESSLSNQSADLETATTSVQSQGSLRVDDSDQELSANKTKVTCGKYKFQTLFLSDKLYLG